MIGAAKAGGAYFAITFAIGFILGTARVLWLAPLVGETLAVIMELPFMLLASWWVAGWLVQRLVLTGLSEKAAMGALGFALLIAAEAVLGVFAFGEPLGEWLASLFRIPGIIGLAGQLGFATMPCLRK